jgi:hypothetical protein
VLQACIHQLKGVDSLLILVKHLAAYLETSNKLFQHLRHRKYFIALQATSFSALETLEGVFLIIENLANFLIIFFHLMNYFRYIKGCKQILEFTEGCGD